MVLADADNQPMHLVINLDQRGASSGAHSRRAMGCAAEPRLKWRSDSGIDLLCLSDRGKSLLE